MNVQSSDENFVSPETWEKIPAEIWTKILSYSHDTRTPRQTTGKRLVCKIWREVIDEHLNFNVNLSDKNFSSLCNMSHIRLNSLTVYLPLCFVSEEHFNESTNVTLMRLNVLKGFHVEAKLSLRILQELIRQMSNLETLYVSYPFPQQNDLLDVNRKLEFDSVLNIFQLRLPNLSKFSLNFPGWLLSDESSTPVVTMLSDLVSFLNQSVNINELKLKIIAIVTNIEILELQLHRQLERLSLELTMELMETWISIMKAQRKLKHVELSYLHDYTGRGSTEDKTRLFDNVQNILVLNQNTLSHIALSSFPLAQPLDVSIFQNMSNLKSLKISAFDILSRLKVTGLGKLPHSLNQLFVSLKVSFACPTDDILRMAERLENIREIRLTGFRSERWHEENVPASGINQQVLDSLARKPNIRHLTLTHLEPRNFSRVIVKTNGNFCMVNGNMLVKLKRRNSGYTIIHDF